MGVNRRTLASGDTIRVKQRHQQLISATIPSILLLFNIVAKDNYALVENDALFRLAHHPHSDFVSFAPFLTLELFYNFVSHGELRVM